MSIRRVGDIREYFHIKKILTTEPLKIKINGRPGQRSLLCPVGFLSLPDPHSPLPNLEAYHYGRTEQQVAAGRPHHCADSNH